MCTAHLNTRSTVEVAGNDAQCAELAAILARRAAARTVIFGGDVNRRRSCAPAGFWTRTDGSADQAPGLQHVYGSGALRSPSAEVVPATHTDHDVLLVRAHLASLGSRLKLPAAKSRQVAHAHDHVRRAGGLAEREEVADVALAAAEAAPERVRGRHRPPAEEDRGVAVGARERAERHLPRRVGLADLAEAGDPIELSVQRQLSESRARVGPWGPLTPMRGSSSGVGSAGASDGRGVLGRMMRNPPTRVEVRTGTRRAEGSRR